MSYFIAANISVNIRQGAFHIETLTLTDGGSAVDIATDYDAIVCQIRNGNTSDAPLIKSVTLEGGGITITNTNELNLNLTTDFAPGNYKGDIRFRLDGTQNWVTLIAMDVVLTASISRKDA
jgi:hypothetical protein